jgi:hypothetical protein
MKELKPVDQIEVEVLIDNVPTAYPPRRSNGPL